MKVGVLGGTFDPVHVGHLMIAGVALERLGLDQVLFVPAGEPWFKKGQQVTEARHRMAMAELAVSSEPRFLVSDVEVRRKGPSYTGDTLGELKSGLDEETKFYVIVGLDALAEFHRWHDPARVLEMCTLVGAARPGFETLNRSSIDSVQPGASDGVVVIDGPLVGVSSSEVRRRVGQGHSTRNWVPEPVDAYIREQRLYVGNTDRKGDSMATAQGYPGQVEAAKKILALAVSKGALTFGEFELSSGGTSAYYFDGRLVTLDPEGAHHVASAFLPVLAGCGAEAIAGPTVGADPIVSSVAVMSYTQGNPIGGLIVRTEAKKHGTGRVIEGNLRPGAAVAVVDDTCSTGGNLLHAIGAVEEAGGRVVKVMCILDRRQGGSDEIRRRGYDFMALLEADDSGRVTPVEG